MTMHLAGRRSAAGKPSPGKPHLLRLSQLAAGVPDAMVSHTKGHADVSYIYGIVVGEIQEAIFEEKIFRIFFTQKKVFFLASQYKTGLYLDLLLENRI